MTPKSWLKRLTDGTNQLKKSISWRNEPCWSNANRSPWWTPGVSASNPQYRWLRWQLWYFQPVSSGNSAILQGDQQLVINTDKILKKTIRWCWKRTHRGCGPRRWVEWSGKERRWTRHRAYFSLQLHPPNPRRDLWISIQYWNIHL